MTATLTIIPTDLKIGQQVDIESRTWPGINKPGGHATITKLHYETTDGTSDGNGGAAGGAPTKIDVKYVLGGTEKQIEITYVKPHVELVRGGRSRRLDKKMTVDSFTTGEKENNGAVGGGGGKKRVNKRKAGGADNVDKSVHKKKKVVQKKNKNDGIAAAANKIEEEQPKVVDDDDSKKKKTKPAPSKKEGKKKATASASTNKTKSIASYFTSTSSATVTASTATTTTTTTSAKTKGPSKPKETTKKVKKTNPNNPPTTATKPKPTKNPKAVKYSPNSILAVRAAHAKSPTQSHIFGTKTIGFSNDTAVKDAQSLLEGFDYFSTTTSSANVRGGVGSKKKKRSVQESLFPEEEEGEERKSAVATTVASLTKKKVTPSSASGKKGGVSSSSSSNNTKDKSVQNHKTIQSLYKNECVKAKDFVNSMFGSATKEDHGGEKMEEDGAASSPESCLELKMDSGRMDLFNSLLSEVMFKKGLESMDVDEMICSINTSSQRGDTVKPFTLLEVKAFLQTLDSQNRIFVSWEEDNSGTIYTI